MSQDLRIVSLIGSATEIICALGLRQQLVGVSHECDYPENVRGLPVLSEPKLNPEASSAEIDREVRQLVSDAAGVYRVKTDVLESLKPDLIVTQDHCDVCAVTLNDVEAACQAFTGKQTRICSLHPSQLADIRKDFMRVAQAAGVPERGKTLLREFDARLDAIAAKVEGRPRPRVLLIEWLQPPMIAGGWMPELARIAGGEPLIVTEPERFETVDFAAIQAADPDVVILLPCGFGVARTLSELNGSDAAGELASLRATGSGRTYVVDGNAFFNRPGPRIADTAEILAGLLHPELGLPVADSVVWRA